VTGAPRRVEAVLWAPQIHSAAAAELGYGVLVLPDADEFSPISLPGAIGDQVLAAEPLRHGQANAATGGI